MKKLTLVIVSVLAMIVMVAGTGCGKKRDGHFVANSYGTVLDESTGLMWAAKDNGEDITWKDAKRYCEEYQGGGYSDWRLPTIKQIKGLYEAGVKVEKGIISISQYRVWSSETSGSRSAASLCFAIGSAHRDSRSYSNGFRVLPVRGGN